MSSLTEDHLYHYRATITSVYDGDTLTCDIDLGFGVIFRKQKLRLARVNTPELRGGTEETKLAGLAARDRVRELVLGQTVILRTTKDRKGKYGRWLAEITSPENGDLADLLLEEGLAVPYGS